MKEKYDLYTVVERLSRIGIKTNNATQKINIAFAHHGQRAIGNRVWGLLDFLCNHMGFQIVDRNTYNQNMVNLGFFKINTYVIPQRKTELLTAA